MDAEGQGFFFVAGYFDHGELQRLGGGFRGLLVFGPEPRGLRKPGWWECRIRGWRARVLVGLRYSSVCLQESKQAPAGPEGERNKHATR